MQVSAIMTRKLTMVDPDMSLSALKDIFNQSKFQHVPVIDAGRRLVGIVSVKDYFKALAPVMDAASEKTLDIFVTSRKTEQVGEYFVEGVVNLKKLYSIDDLVTAARIIVDIE